MPKRKKAEEFRKGFDTNQYQPWRADNLYQPRRPIRILANATIAEACGAEKDVPSRLLLLTHVEFRDVEIWMVNLDTTV
uniref:Uncharacterized protein n=1 Tax=Magallana gigas TaxID=29159 RepID=K1QXR7_MAGGI